MLLCQRENPCHAEKGFMGFFEGFWEALVAWLHPGWELESYGSRGLVGLRGSPN